MSIALSIMYAALVPVGCLGLMLWLARLEEGLNASPAGPEPPSAAARPIGSVDASESSAEDVGGLPHPATSVRQVAGPSNRPHRASGSKADIHAAAPASYQAGQRA
jgi:hypothetical protein